MKARTRNNKWLSFTLDDLPVPFNETEFVLLKRPGTPILDIKSIRRGVKKYGLFEGDVILMDGEKWLVCYERGFYVINSNYVVKYFYQLKNYKVIGTCDTIKDVVSISFKSKHFFMYKDNIFYLANISGAYDGKLLIRSIEEPIDTKQVNQECCLVYNGKKLFLGMLIDGKYPVKLRGGRITIKKNGQIIDLDGGK